MDTNDMDSKDVETLLKRKMLKTKLKFQNEDVFDLDKVFCFATFKHQVLVNRVNVLKAFFATRLLRIKCKCLSRVHIFSVSNNIDVDIKNDKVLQLK